MVVNDGDVWVPRVVGGEKDDIPDYAHPDYFTVKVWHGGCKRGEKYVGGKADYYDNVDKDRMSLVEVDNMVTGINPAYAAQRIDYWYKVGSEDDEFMKLETDLDVVTMCTAVPHWRLIIMYLDHMELHEAFGDEDEDVFMYEDFFFNQGGSSGVVIEELPQEPRKKATCVITELPDEPRPGRSKGVIIREVEDCVPTQASTACGIGRNDKGKQKLLEYSSSSKQKQSGVSHSSLGQVSSGVRQSSLGLESSQGNVQSSLGQGSNIIGSSGVYEGGERIKDIDVMDYLQTFGGLLEYECEDYQEHEKGSDDDDYNPLAEDEDYDQYGVDDDEWLEDVEQEEPSRRTTHEAASVGQVPDFEDNEDMFAEEGSDEEQPDFFINSDGEQEEVGLEFNPKTDMKRPVFKLGMKFGTVQILRDALREMAIQGGWEYVYIKNDKVRLRVVCKEDDCPFELFASKLQHEATLMIKGYNSKHTCTRKFNNKMVKLKYLTTKFKDQIAMNEAWKPDSLAKTMSANIKARVSTQMAYKTKRAALLEVEGSIRYQFARLKDYGSELKRVDPETTIDIKCDFSNTRKEPLFKRMYICLGALKNGIKAGCRSVIGLDGAHLKSCFGGQLLTAVGVDANNTSWVVAYAMVEIESKDSWTWFLELLCNDLDIKEDGAGWVFISDKQKGLKPAFEEVVPSAHIRFCVRHMWTNFTKLFPGKVMKDQMWKCAKSTTLPYYQNDMEEMKSLDKDAYDWMTDDERPPKHWCRAFFNTSVNCDIMDNNLCESFNGWLVEARKKPPVTMFEEIRVKLMKRIQMRKEKMEAFQGNICPKPRKVLEKNKIKAATDCIPTFNGGDEAEVENIEGTKNVVNMRHRTCSCRRWDLTGIPCKHAVSAIHLRRHDPDDYVADCYLKKTYLAIYNNLIRPVNSMDMWQRSDDPPILPPQYSRQPGRPKTKRIKDASEKAPSGEGKLRRQQRSLRCGNCGQVGHNMKTCQRHLPPKEKKTAAVSRKRKVSSEDGQGSENQTKKGKKCPLTANQLRIKAKERAEYQRKKLAAAKAANLAANRSAHTTSTSRPQQAASRPTTSRTQPTTTAPTSSRPPQASTPSTNKAETSTRSSQRIRERSGTGDGN